ncbi:hypothetical protein J3B02_004683 [Coemansia erecta]|nr:hypothetical protein J3B02_004683 [Coemansia erecta]
MALRTAKATVASANRLRWYATQRAPDTCNTKTTTDQTMLLPGQFLVGAPHPLSNIRPVRFYVPLDETPQELTYRKLRESALAQDHAFWLDNNRRFEQGKVEFENRTVAEKGSCTLDDLSVYFRRYQEESYARHLRYNREVWRRNLRMVVPGIRAWWQEIRRRERRRGEGVARHSGQQLVYFGREGSGDVERAADTKKPKPADGASDSVDRRAEKIKSYY